MPKALDLFPNRNTIFMRVPRICIYFFSEKSWFAFGDTGTWKFIYKLGLNGSSSWSRSFTKMQTEEVMLAWVYEVKITTSVLARPNGAWQQYNDALSPSTCPKWINIYKTRVYSCVQCSTNLKILTQCKSEKKKFLVSLLLPEADPENKWTCAPPLWTLAGSSIWCDSRLPTGQGCDPGEQGGSCSSLAWPASPVTHHYFHCIQFAARVGVGGNHTGAQNVRKGSLGAVWGWRPQNKAEKRDKGLKKYVSLWHWH